MSLAPVSSQAKSFWSLLYGAKTIFRIYLYQKPLTCKDVAPDNAGIFPEFSLSSDFQLERLQDPQVWLDAATQIFYSFGLGFGGMIGFSSYNPKKNNCEKDAIIVSIVNWFTAILASVVIFSVLGFKATVMYENCILR